MTMNQRLSYRLLMLQTLFLAAMSVAAAADRFYLDAVNVEPGETKTLIFNLDNSQEFYGFQADIVLPAGLEIVKLNGRPDCTLSSRVDASYTLVSNLLANGNIRLGAFSTDHTSISGDRGALLYVHVKAGANFSTGSLLIRNILFVNVVDRDVELPDYSIELGAVLNNRFYLPDFKIAVGETKEVSLMLDNEIPFSAFQTDIYMPEGLTIVAGSFEITSRGASGHSVSAKSFSDGRTRIASFSLNNDIFQGNSGALLTFQVSANKNVAEISDIEMKNQIFTMAGAKEYVLPNSLTKVKTERTFVESISLDYSTLTLVEGNTQLLSATVMPTLATIKNVEWSSLNKEVAAVSEDGVVTALSVGTTTITVSAVDGSGVKAFCTVNVIPTPAKGITITQPDKTSFKVGETIKLSATVFPNDTTDLGAVWASSNTNVATVDATGMVTAIDVGAVVITATNSVGQSDSIVLTVEKTHAETLLLNRTSVEMKVTDTLPLQAIVYPTTTTDKSIEWTSSNSSIVKVDDSGKMAALALGNAVITAKTLDGSNLTDECKVNVISGGSSGMETIDLDDVKVIVNERSILIENLTAGVPARLIQIDGTVLNVEISVGLPILFNVEQNSIYILNLGRYSLKLIVQ